jgi:hypothetical protein
VVDRIKNIVGMARRRPCTPAGLPAKRIDELLPWNWKRERYKSAV